MKITTAAACTALIGALTLSPFSAFAGQTQESYEQALTAATEAKAKASSVGGEWRDVGKLLKNAEKAAKDGNYDKAVKLANQAQVQCEVGYEQALSQKDAGPIWK